MRRVSYKPYMAVWIALLSGVNVGGNNILPMKELRNILANLGFQNVRTYIQSGNCVFQSDERKAAQIEKWVGEAIDNRFGFRPQIFVLTADALDAVVAGNPYKQGDDDPKSVHISFLAKPAKGANLSPLEAFREGGEDFTLTDRAFYLYAPNGIGRSKLAAKIERHVSVPMTARNLRSVMKIAELARTI